MSFRFVPKSVTLNDLGPYFALFHRIFVQGVVVQQLLGLGLPRYMTIKTICAII